MQKRREELLNGYLESGNLAGAVRIVGGSVEDFDERYEPSFGGSHPDERLEAHA